MKQMLKFLTCVLCILFITSISFAHGDTVRYRSMKYIFPDSISIMYQIGSLGLKTTSGISYLRFKQPIVCSATDSFLRSVNFSSTHSTDSIIFKRVAFADDKFAPKKACVETGSPTYDSLLNVTTQRYSTPHRVSTDPAFFNSTSRISFITQICRVSDDVVLASIDTLYFLLDGNGYIRYRTLPVTPSIRKVSLAVITPNTPVYIRVIRVDELPYGASISLLSTFEATGNLPAKHPYVSSTYWHTTPTTSFQRVE